MHRNRSFQHVCHAALYLFMLTPSTGHAAVTVYTSLATFQAAATSATLLVDFETRNALQANPFTDHTLTFSSTNSLYIITPANPGTTSPLPPSRMLSASGIEDFTVVMPSASAVGFTLLNNAYGPHTVTLTEVNNVPFVYHPTQAHNTIGFIGFTSTTAIVKLRWQSVNGQIQNTALDNFYWQSLASPTTLTTWGRLKTLYR